MHYHKVELVHYHKVELVHYRKVELDLVVMCITVTLW